MRRQPATSAFSFAEDRYVSHFEPKPAGSIELCFLLAKCCCSWTKLWL